MTSDKEVLTASDEHRFPCESCGSDLRFDPGKDRLVCDYCGNVQDIEHGVWRRPSATTEHDFDQVDKSPELFEYADIERLSACPNCGAKIEFDGNAHATECPFCATPVVADTEASRRIKPQAVLPFILDEDEARVELVKWLGSLWFAPGGLKEYARKGRRLNGIYTPCWTFDADTKTRYRGQRGIVYYEEKTVRRNGENQTVRVARTDWTRVSGRVARFFDDVLIVASNALPRQFRAGIANWDLTRLEPYSPEYLAGFRSEAYTVDVRDGYIEAQDVIDRQIIRDIRFDIGGDKQRIDAVETQISDVTFKHILVPIWIAAYKYRGRSFRFVVNGQSGAVSGERPWSALKLMLAICAAIILAVAVGYIYATTQ